MRKQQDTNCNVFFFKPMIKVVYIFGMVKSLLVMSDKQVKRYVTYFAYTVITLCAILLN